MCLKGNTSFLPSVMERNGEIMGISRLTVNYNTTVGNGALTHDRF